MKKTLFAVLATLTFTSGAVAQSLATVPVHDKPVWQQVQSIAEAPGAPVAVRSLATNQVIGALPIDYKFLSFGTNGQVTTLGFNGEVGYIPSTAAGRLYPKVPEAVKPPAGPDTLEDLAEAYEEKVTGQAKVSLKPTNSVVDSVAEQQAALAVAGGTTAAVNPIMPYAGQPGAALATGGVGGIGAMVGGAAGPYGNQPSYFPNAGMP